MARIGLSKHRKFRALVRVLKSPVTARGSLEMVWDAGYETLDPIVGTANDIEEVAYWKGAKGALAQALIDVGFLDELPGGLLAIHDFWENAPEYARRRAKRQHLGPWSFTSQPPNGGQTADKTTPDVSQTADTVQSNGGQNDDHDVTRHDVTRRDERETALSGVHEDATADAAEVWRQAAESAGVVFRLGFSHTELHQLGELARAYPLADIRLAAEHYWRSKRRLKTVAFFRKDFEAELDAARREVDEGGRRPPTAWECPKCGEIHEATRDQYQAKWCPRERAEVVA